MRSAVALALISSFVGTVSMPAADAEVVVEPGTHIPLTVINGISTKHSVEGDRVYLQTAFPITVNGRIAIPPGSYVMGTVTHLKRPGRVKGRGELFLRFDTLTLPNGVTRDFRGRLSSVDASADERVQSKDNEGMIKGDGNAGGDVKTIGEAAAAGAAVGVIAGSAAKAAGVGAAAGASAGAVIGVLGVLLSRGPEAMLSQGSTIEMVLDRPVTFEVSELDFSGAAPTHTMNPVAPPAQPAAPASPRFPF